MSFAGVDAEGRRRRARVAGEATVRWRDLVATGRLQGEFPLVQFARGTEEEALLEKEGEENGSCFVEASRRRRSLLRAPPRGYDEGTDGGMTTSALGDDQPTLSAELAWFAFEFSCLHFFFELNTFLQKKKDRLTFSIPSIAFFSGLSFPS